MITCFPVRLRHFPAAKCLAPTPRMFYSRRMPFRLFARAWAASSALTLLAGCATPDLRLVSKPAMQFGETRGYANSLRLASQHEPGRLATGGAQASVCTFCR